MTPMRNGGDIGLILSCARTEVVTPPLRLVIAAAAALLLAAPAGAGPDALRCRPTPPDAAGPFGRGAPPLRAKIGTGHVLTGVVLSAIDCRPIRGAQVQLWQSNRNGRYTTRTSGTVITNGAGRFRFQGPYPPSYEGRRPHIHIRVFARLHEPLLSRYEPRTGARSGHIRLVLVPEEL
jgi:protocatechuate 3,4-dioxygenase beta subunit